MATVAPDTAIGEMLKPSAPAVTPAKRAKKKLVRRLGQDHSQMLRRGFQFAFLALNIYLGLVFYLWVRAYETGGVPGMARPSGVEGYLPIAGMMNFKYWLLSERMPEVHPAAMFLLLAFVATAFLFRKAFCSWLCPVGTISEYLWRLGHHLFRRNFRLPRWLDIPLRGLKYLLLAFFVWAVTGMSAAEINSFMRSPYGLIADVKMLDFFRFLSETGLIVVAVLVAASVLVQNFWCRYLCPYGALLGLAALPGPLRIRRNPQACIDCAKCAKACPYALPVDKLVSIKSAECTGCLECVAVCPAQDALAMAAPRWRVLPPWAMAAGIAALFFGITGYARLSGHWQTHLPDSVYQQLVPHADQATHPMPGEMR
jgi:polyferredoxin